MSDLVGADLTVVTEGSPADIYDISLPVVHREPSFGAADISERPGAWTIIAACSSDGTVDGVLQLGVVPTLEVTSEVRNRALAGAFLKHVESCPARGADGR
ncbi:MAG: hypothetical protein EON52_18520 [Actinomycetales bacterium]|nr:MAG: hypothetical protein EON52_18520 [Actinomycetales bacterium]